MVGQYSLHWCPNSCGKKLKRVKLGKDTEYKCSKCRSYVTSSQLKEKGCFRGRGQVVP